MGQPGLKEHSFTECLARSHSYEDAAWWPVVYRKAFPTFLAMTSVRADGWHQRAGIDRVITLANSKQILIDEKVRDNDYGDIILERWSDRERLKPGWVQRADLACDFIAYAIAPTEMCYLLPFHLLRSAWRQFGPQWCKWAEANNGKGSYGFRVVCARNNGYTTESIAVPTDTLFSCIERAMKISWQN